MKLTLRVLFLLFFASAVSGLYASSGEGGEGETKPYNMVEEAMHHIADANEFHLVGDWSIPLPIILYAPGNGFIFGTSSMFHHGEEAVDGYILNHGRVNRIADPSFPSGHVELGHAHAGNKKMMIDGKMTKTDYITYEGKDYALDKPSTIDGGLLGGGLTSFYDFSITKNVLTMMMAALFLIIIWTIIKNSYKRREGLAPSGMQAFFEPIFVFMQDEVTKPMIGEKHYERFQPFIMTLFFFILFCNLLGLIPFFPGSANVTGNLAVTMALAIMVFVVTTISGKKDYWMHTLAMPGVPWYVLLILTPVEILGLFIKPFSLMIRLFANISAGHIIILSLIGLIFVFGDAGNNPSGAATGVIVGGAFTAFMNLIELLVAFLQAFIFAMLAASYIGAAVEEHHHDSHDGHGGDVHGYAAAVEHQH